MQLRRKCTYHFLHLMKISKQTDATLVVMKQFGFICNIQEFIGAVLRTNEKQTTYYMFHHATL